MVSEILVTGTTVDVVLIAYNAIVCCITSLALMFFERNGATHRRWASWIAWALCVSYMSFPIRFLFGQVLAIDWSTLVINTVFCAAIICLRGNVAQLFKNSGATHGTNAKRL